jgi:hypothetical protein
MFEGAMAPASPLAPPVAVVDCNLQSFFASKEKTVQVCQLPTKYNFTTMFGSDSSFLDRI